MAERQVGPWTTGDLVLVIKDASPDLTVSGIAQHIEEKRQAVIDAIPVVNMDDVKRLPDKKRPERRKKKKRILDS